MIKCVTGKKVYTSQEMAEDALLDAWTRYNVSPTNGPIAVYRCDDCGQWHLTSKGTMNEKLSKFIADGKVQKQSEIDYWEKKLKK